MTCRCEHRLRGDGTSCAHHSGGRDPAIRATVLGDRLEERAGTSGEERAVEPNVGNPLPRIYKGTAPILELQGPNFSVNKRHGQSTLS